MDTSSFREQPVFSDIDAVASILKGSGFFNGQEQQVGVSLVEERLEKGEECGYFFQFSEQNGKVLGYTCFGPIPGTQSSFDLYWIAVDNDFRGKGLGTELLNCSEREIAKRGGTRVYIETSSTPLYVPTRSFYERNGYMLEAELKDYYAPGDNKLLYVKAL
ncbi:acetyltransferase [Sphaerochaeta pleomorpha str. Grapes]|uniref:Acetyltransferase n=1 Tax=Sphaerochaeta pleomorpha (strain ATCC BAA-1885 / DSM 22778 / Grapes) TaxID=158190 RepID=G8QR93_SPHPG|nr:GNAT family N-acetyltransferase [Sphaerochaeta pleomorpha]AEV28746.1 acetyltransferase [Sphaerochaeta pleomorpha str. Grapes]